METAWICFLCTCHSSFENPGSPCLLQGLAPTRSLVDGGMSVPTRAGGAEPVITRVVSLLSLQREPSIDLLEAFVEHWKGITHYYIESTGGAWAPLQGSGKKVWAESPCSSGARISRGR